MQPNLEALPPEVPPVPSVVEWERWAPSLALPFPELLAPILAPAPSSRAMPVELGTPGSPPHGEHPQPRTSLLSPLPTHQLWTPRARLRGLLKEHRAFPTLNLTTLKETPRPLVLLHGAQNRAQARCRPQPPLSPASSVPSFFPTPGLQPWPTRPRCPLVPSFWLSGRRQHIGVSWGPGVGDRTPRIPPDVGATPRGDPVTLVVGGIAEGGTCGDRAHLVMPTPP